MTLNLLAWLRGEKADLAVKTREPITPSYKVAKEKVEKSKEYKKETEQGAMLLACSKCGKTFTRPLLLLDFSTGKSRLINVCPYCNAKLGENEKTEPSEFYVKEPEEKKAYKTE
ncbi:MAG: hypothetical protein QXX79_02820 [Candidatus Bathyarchaeia archaeon]